MNSATRFLTARLREQLTRVFDLARDRGSLVGRLAAMTNAELEAFLRGKSHA